MNVDLDVGWNSSAMNCLSRTEGDSGVKMLSTSNDLFEMCGHCATVITATAAMVE